MCLCLSSFRYNPLANGYCGEVGYKNTHTELNGDRFIVPEKLAGKITGKPFPPLE